MSFFLKKDSDLQLEFEKIILTKEKVIDAAKNELVKEKNAFKPSELYKQAKAEKKLTSLEAEDLNIDLERVRLLSYNLMQTEKWNDTHKEFSSSDTISYDDGTLKTYQKSINFSKGLNNIASKPERLKKFVENYDNSRLRNNKRRKVLYDQIDYINQRNYKFNLKLSRAFDSYTENTRKNLERGTR